MNEVILTGRMKDDFKINKVGDKQVAKATLIVDRNLSKQKKEELKAKGQQTADFIPFEIWGSDARINMLNDNVKKGDKLLIDGSIVTGSYENKDKVKVFTTTVNVSEFEFEFKKKTGNFDDVEL